MIHLVLMFHDTLTLQHLDLCIHSISNKNQLDDIFWDSINIYNSCSYISNSEIIKFLNIHGIKYDKLNVLDVSDVKTLNADLHKISIQMTGVIGNILFLKGDYSINRNLYKVLEMYKHECNFLYSLPVINAKEFVIDEDIETLLKEDNFIIANDCTYYRGSDLFQPIEEISSNGFKDTDECIKFVSWGGSLDYNVHLISSDVLHFFDGYNSSCTWGGCHAFKSMSSNSVKIYDNKHCFCVHKYHDIISKNNNQNRGDLRKLIIGQRY